MRMPRWLNADLTERDRVRPVTYSPTLQRRATSSAKMSLVPGIPVAMHDFFELFTPAGSAGIFRVTEVDDTVPSETQYTLLHAIDTLADSVWKAQLDYSGTYAGFLTALLAQQTTARWQLGDCAITGAYKRSGINYDPLNELLTELMETPPLNGYCLEYDFSTTPWTLHLRAAPAGVRSEFRLSRNIERCEIRRSDADLCTRLYASIHTSSSADNVTQDSVEIRTYNNTAAQALYGIVERTADIDTADVADPNAWAADFLAQRAHPTVQIRIDGLRLKALTGLDWDEYSLAALCRVALPDIGEALEERVESLTWPDPLRDEKRVTVELANRLPKFSDSIASIKKQAGRAGSAARKAARSGAQAKDLKYWSAIVTDATETIDNTGLKELKETGIVLVPGSARIYSLTQGLNALQGEITVNSDKVSIIVEGSYGSYGIKAASIVAAINDTGSSVQIDADKIYLNGAVIADAISANSTMIDHLMSGQAKANSMVIGTAAADYIQIVGQGSLSVSSNASFYMQGLNVSWQSANIPKLPTITMTELTATQRDVVYISGGMETHGNYYLITSYKNGSVSSNGSNTINYLGR